MVRLKVAAEGTFIAPIKFQFHVVRLKDEDIYEIVDGFHISIPCGSIKRQPGQPGCCFFYISIPCGSIKSSELSELPGLCVISIPCGSIKSGFLSPHVFRHPLFQFHVVRLKDQSCTAPLTDLIISIPCGSIKR